MKPEEKARLTIDKKLIESGWVIQDVKSLNLSASLGVAVREFPTSTGPMDYALFIEGVPVGVIEAKKTDEGENITAVEGQSSRYANSTFKWIKSICRIRFAYEASDKLTRFTDYNDIKYRSRTVFSFHRPETLNALLKQADTIRNNMKHFPEFDPTGFRKCQITAIENLDKSFADNRPKALVQMATGAGKTFTAITAAYRLLKYSKMNRILFLVDTKGLGEQAECEFLAYRPTDDNRSFSQIYGVHRLRSSYIPDGVQICISTIQRMYSILKGDELDESAEETSFNEFVTADSKAPKEVVYNEKYPPEFFDVIIIDTGSNILDYTISALLTASDILALSTCDVVSAKRIDGVLEDILLNVDGFDRGKMRLLVNKYDPAFNISPDELSGVLQMPLVGIIPDCREITNVNNGGNSVFYGNTKSADKQKAFANAVRIVAKRMLELDAGDHIAHSKFEDNRGQGFFSNLFRRK